MTSHTWKTDSDFTIPFQRVLQMISAFGDPRNSPSDSSDAKITAEEPCQLKYGTFECKGRKCREIGPAWM